MPAPDQAVLGFAPAALDIRALARRVGPRRCSRARWWRPCSWQGVAFMR